MSTTLLEYVIAYLQEEQRESALEGDWRNDNNVIMELVANAIDAYDEGAR